MSCDVDLDYSENSENTGSVGIWRRGPLKCVNNLIGEREGERQRERERERVHADKEISVQFEAIVTKGKRVKTCERWRRKMEV